MIRHGVIVNSSRETDKTVGLSDRPRMANNWGADCFISIHCNSASFTAYGIETFAYKAQYRNMADKVHRRLIENTSLYYANRGVKFADFCVLRETNMDACLVEMAFISNERDSQLLRNKQEEYAIAITKGILDYLGLTWKDEGNSTPPPVIEQPKPTPPQPSKSKIDVFYKFDNLPWVKNLEDDAGLRGVNARNLYVYPSKGEVLFRVSAVNRDYYPWVQNYKVSNGYYDFAGNGVAIDRVQMKLRGLDGYSIRYRVRLTDGTLLPWVVNDSDFAGIRGRAISNIEIEII